MAEKEEEAEGNGLSRRNFLKMAPAAVIAGAAGTALQSNGENNESRNAESKRIGYASTDKNLDLSYEGLNKRSELTASSEDAFLDYEGPGMDPKDFLFDFDYGEVVREKPDGSVVREWEIDSIDKEIEVAHGVNYPAWTYNGQVPGPTLRCTEGDTVRIHFTNKGSNPHTIHFHGIHPANMDGVFEVVRSGESFTYEFEAEPFGVHEYHCHMHPLEEHVARGLYGGFIVDPKTPRPPAKEMVMVMNGYDVDFDRTNEFYTVNGYSNFYEEHPIVLEKGEKARVYLINMTEFDPINSIHTHAEFFKLYRTGTDLENYEFTDTAMFCQGERGIVEFSYKFPGMYLFHAHQQEFAELGWIGYFYVEGEDNPHEYLLSSPTCSCSRHSQEIQE